jgi:hypothetical protein
MLVTVLWRVAGSPAPSPAGAAPFRDVPAGEWYSDAVAWARGAGAVQGYSDSLFGTSGAVLREEAAQVLFRYAAARGYDVGARAGAGAYRDWEDTSPWAREALQWAVAAGLIMGRDDGRLLPGGALTRAQAAAVIARFQNAYAREVAG